MTVGSEGEQVALHDSERQTKIGKRQLRQLRQLRLATVAVLTCALLLVAGAATLVAFSARANFGSLTLVADSGRGFSGGVPRRFTVDLSQVNRCPSERLNASHLPCRKYNRLITGVHQQLPLRMQDDFVGHSNDFRLMQDRIRIVKGGVYSLQLQLQFLYKFETPTELSALVYVNGTGEFLCVASAAGSRSGIAACSVNAHLRLGAGNVIDFRVTVAGVGVLAERRSSFIVLHRLS